MENITINQKQLFDVIKRTMSLSKEYAIEKLDADGNFIVFINGDFTDFFILRKSLVDYISTKSSAYIKLQETCIKFTKSANARAKELFKREDEIKSLKEELKSLRDDKKCKSYKVAKTNYDELYKTHADLQAAYNKLIDNHKNLSNNYNDLQHISDSYKNDIEILRTANKNLRADNENYYGIKSQNDQLVVSYNQLESNYKYVLSQNEELNSVVKHNKTEIAILKDTIEELRAKIKTQDAIIEINKEKIEKQDKEIQSYKNINKQSKSDL